ncbi:DUF1120 domain-containing protein [Burkholderia dolosa]|uniref:DUF1120 domain-containing protein n=1 Tax=Burkholderia dolosa TaxID=152500 RepID=A0A892ID35_9BURK|nr:MULTISPECIES: DUF1120 domain-containing protein [Burkholderia]AYZ94330.1 DUF1120 domain-containing protein [Burkholderia dolosa]MBR8420202.1 DUF1120 domain-containing protein [Burkholderia dolosa]MBY4658386.1 DUF1120 domain-containing protein [Burkholderia dolosa]MBY4691893.1 DUF1120 domain-containing protein [Burkholderia dolosa]MBY4781493.1 DUF1120 domain-containing protein [Burkholderia dolosa]
MRFWQRFPPLNRGYSVQRTTQKIALVAALGLGAALPAHSQSADLTVKGTIRPTACTMTLGNNGEVDHGNIFFGRLSETAPTELDTKEVPLAVNCSGPTRFALGFADNRAGTAHAPGNDQFGLGEVDGTKIGAYQVEFANESFTGDGSRIDSIQTSSDNGETWKSHVTATASTESLLGFADSTEAGPAPLEQLAGAIRVKTSIAPSNTLPVADSVPLDGSATLELKYL